MMHDENPGRNGGHHDHASGGCCGHDHGTGMAETATNSQAARLSGSEQSGPALLTGRGLKVVRNGRVLIDDVTIGLKPREIVTLIGPNGAGKSTLVRAMLGLEPLAAGRVERSPGLTIGYVPQRFDVDRTIPLSVIRFLNLGNRHTPYDISGALGEVGAAHLLRSQVTELSGGELQRVLLARALLRRPGLFVLDEPVQGLDHLGEAEMYNLIANVRDAYGAAILLVSHDLNLVMAKTDRVICLNRHVCCSGHPDAVAAHPSYAHLFGAEAARAFGVYTHHHDHCHDVTGAPMALSPLAADREAAVRSVATRPHVEADKR